MLSLWSVNFLSWSILHTKHKNWEIFYFQYTDPFKDAIRILKAYLKTTQTTNTYEDI